MQLVISAGNSSSALNTIGDPAVATDVVSVGADITKETWQANYGSTVGFKENIMPFSSGGPREDGGFKPNITAPGAAISHHPVCGCPALRSRRPATPCERATRCCRARRWPRRRRRAP